MKKKSSLLRNLVGQIGFAIKIANLLRKPQLVANAAKTFAAKWKDKLWIAILPYGRVSAPKSHHGECAAKVFTRHHGECAIKVSVKPF